MKKQDSFHKILMSVFGIALLVIGAAVIFKIANDNTSLELRSKAAEYKDVVVKEWKFDKGTEGWSGIGTIKVDQGDNALRGKLLEIYGKDGYISNAAVNEKMAQGLKYIKFKLALRQPVIARSSPDKGSCIQAMVTCPNGKQQPVYTPDCKRIPCPPFVPSSEADCNKFSGTSEFCNNQPNCQYGSEDSVCHYRPRRIVTGVFISPTPCPTDLKSCPDGTKVGRIHTGNGCKFQECPVVRVTPTPATYNVVVQYLVDNQWASQVVKVKPNESYTEFSVQLPLKALTIQRIRFLVPVAAFQYTFWFDWMKLWSKVVIPPTPTNTPTPKPTFTPTPTPKCIEWPTCAYTGTVDNRGTIVYCSPPPPPVGRVYCPKPTSTPLPPTPTPRPLGKCVKSGCSAQRCTDEYAVSKGAETCVWQEIYQCYAMTTCERQNGVCSWVRTPEYVACMARYEVAPKSEADCNRYSPAECDGWGQYCTRDAQDNYAVCHYRPQRFMQGGGGPAPVAQ